MHTFEFGFDFTNFYFIGIGGINMSALAEVLHLDGYAVAGSDKSDSAAVAHLRDIGVNINIGHDTANLPEKAQVVVYNAAVPPHNPEMQEARARGLHFLDRAELLGLLMKNYETAICIAGTHGKTTTTSMLAQIFMDAGADPTVMSGGVLPSMGGAMRVGGDRRYFIAEACEYHNSFLKFYPYIGIILNLEMDHGDFFEGEAGLRASFRKFAEKIPKDGLLVINSEIRDYHEITNDLICNVLTFGTNGDLKSEDIDFKLAVPGAHNVSNAMAAMLAAEHCLLDAGGVVKSLENFTGALRRFERKGTFKGAHIVDDYAHHPTEVTATLTAAKTLNPRHLWVIFQPHTLNRTAEFLDEFAKSLAIADKVLILDIYRPAGREQEAANVHARDLADKISDSIYLDSFEKAAEYLKQNLQKGDMAITMGAGDIYKVGEMLDLTPHTMI
ncbi:MAG: UDP-N-acetylmuramate--L-alanine ligase [Defluviitaleaceae bacterium]|nr:UDP-N-acetylmuramate--L-alanine ligase [Defluviitaleaceae bacterium]